MERTVVYLVAIACGIFFIPGHQCCSPLLFKGVETQVEIIPNVTIRSSDEPGSNQDRPDQMSTSRPRSHRQSKMTHVYKKINNAAAVRAVAEANSRLSTTLLAVLRKEIPGNLIFSPLSLSTVVAMTHLGARGSTATEISSAFNFPKDNRVLMQGYSQVLISLQETTHDYILATASRLYTETGFSLTKKFSGSIQRYFRAEVQQLNFSNSAASAAEINSWVEEVTYGQIKELIQPSGLNSLTRLLLVNGVYFKGQWEHPFNELDTEKEPFYLNEQDWVEVDMMFNKGEFPYVKLKVLDAHAVALPYNGGRLIMVIYVPFQINGLSIIEDGLKDLSTSKVLRQLNSRSDIHVFLPRFKVESTLFLVEPLKTLGAKSMFSSGADFSGIPKSDARLYVSEIVQKAVIEVNEDGSEAAAATFMGSVDHSFSPGPTPTEFRADRPFYFQIVDRNTNFVLFAGTCENPEAESI